MPLMYFLNASSSLDSVAESSEEVVTATEALGLSGLGFGIVFAVLLVLMGFIVVMSIVLNKGGSQPKKTTPPKKVEKPVTVAPKKPVAEAAKPVDTAVVPEGAMFVTLGGKKHTVTVVEKLPQFTVKLNGKVHSVDVEPVKEDAE